MKPKMLLAAVGLFLLNLVTYGQNGPVINSVWMVPLQTVKPGFRWRE